MTNLVWTNTRSGENIYFFVGTFLEVFKKRSRMFIKCTEHLCVHFKISANCTGIRVLKHFPRTVSKPYTIYFEVIIIDVVTICFKSMFQCPYTYEFRKRSFPKRSWIHVHTWRNFSEHLGDVRIFLCRFLVLFLFWLQNHEQNIQKPEQTDLL